MITEKLITELRAAFRVFGIDESVRLCDPTHIEAGDIDVLAMGTTEDAVFIIAPRPFGTPSYIDISLPRTAVMAVVEWHLKNPRQTPLPFDAE